MFWGGRIGGKGEVFFFGEWVSPKMEEEGVDSVTLLAVTSLLTNIVILRISIV